MPASMSAICVTRVILGQIIRPHSHFSVRHNTVSIIVKIFPYYNTNAIDANLDTSQSSGH